MIDFHIIHRAQKSPYFQQALDSLAGESVFVFEDKFKSQTISRMFAYTKGTNEYVSFCDDDDVVRNLDKVKEFLIQTKAPAVYTNSNLVDSEGKLIRTFNSDDHVWSYEDMCNLRQQIHQLVVIRRDVAEKAMFTAHQRMLALNAVDVFDFTFYFEVAKLCGWTYFPEACYDWRQWDNGVQLHTTLSRHTGDIAAHYLAELKSSKPIESETAPATVNPASRAESAVDLKSESSSTNWIK